MAKVTENIPYYRRIAKTGRWHWEPPAWARALGVKSRAYGPDTPEARADARMQNERLRALRRDGGATVDHAPPGSLRAFWNKWRRTEGWRRKGAGTRAEFERVWPRINAAMGAELISRIGPGHLERLQVRLEREASDYDRWRTMKKLASILKAAEGYGVIGKAPRCPLPNPQPRGRSEIFTAADVAALVAAAESLDDETMACAISLIWEAAVSPVDARTLIPAELFAGREGPYLHRPRSKTQTAIYAPISPELHRRIMQLAAPDGAEPLPTAPVFRRPDGRPFTGPQDFAKRFARIRKAAFGAGETRKMLDLRRGANVEMAVGDASREDRARALGNAMDTDNRLHETYTPATLEASRRAHARRAEGRALMEQTRTQAEQDSEPLVSEIRNRNHGTA